MATDDAPHISLAGLHAALGAIESEGVDLSPDIIGAARVLIQFGTAMKEAKANWSGAPERQRLAMVAALEAATGVLRGVDEFARDHLDAPLTELQKALLNLDHNRVAAILEPTRHDKVQADKSAAMMKGRAAAALQLLLDAGENHAAELVAGALTTAGISKPKGGTGDSARITAATVKGWRKDAREGSADAPIRVRYEAMLKLANERGVPPGDAAKNILAAFRTRTPAPGK